MNTPLTNSGAPRGAVVITGASTGIGRACALSLDALGFRGFLEIPHRDGELCRAARADPVRRALPVWDALLPKRDVLYKEGQVVGERYRDLPFQPLAIRPHTAHREGTLYGKTTLARCVDRRTDRRSQRREVYESSSLAEVAQKPALDR